MISNSGTLGFGKIPDTGGTINPEFPFPDVPAIVDLAFDGRDLWGVSSLANQSPLYKLNQSTGSVTFIGDVPKANTGGLTYDVANDTLWGSKENGPGTPSSLFKISRTDASISDEVSVDMSGKGGRLDGLGYDSVNNILYGAAEAGNIVRLDRTTGAATQVATVAPSQIGGIAYQEGFIYTHNCCDTTEGMLKIDPVAGTFTNLGQITTNLSRRNGWAPTVLGAPGPAPTDFTWTSTGSGDWNSSENWSASGPGSPGTSDNFANHTAIFGDNITANSTVFSDIGVSVRGITFDSANSYAIAGHGPVNLVEGTHVLPQNLTGDSSIAVIQGSHQFQLPVELQNSTDVDVASGSSLTLVNTLSLNGNTLTKTGDGNLVIGSVLNTGNGTFDCLQGTCSGSGTIGGNLNNAGGTISPGSSSSVSAVPEPSTFILAVGALSLALVRRW